TSTHLSSLSLHDALPIFRPFTSDRGAGNCPRTQFGGFLMVERGNGPNLLTMPACGAMLWPDLQATAREAKNLENDSKKSFGEFKIGRAHVELQSRFDIVC